MNDTELAQAVERLKCETDCKGRLAVVRSYAPSLDVHQSDDFETAATELAMATLHTIDLALEVLGHDEEQDERTRFLLFTMGAIACRRLQERRKARELFEIADPEFKRAPFLLHLRALYLLDGSLEDLRAGLKLEEHAYQQTKPHAGAAHAIACFILKIAQNEGMDAADEVQELRRALEFLDEAQGERPTYAKYFSTRGDIHRQLGEYSKARADFMKAMEYEDRRSLDASDRLRDYKLGLALINVDQTVRRLNQTLENALADIKQDVTALEERTHDAVGRLDSAEIGVLTAIAFVASAIGLVQVTVGNFGQRPFLEVVGLVAMLGIVLFSAVGVGSWILRRSRQATPKMQAPQK